MTTARTVAMGAALALSVATSHAGVIVVDQSSGPGFDHTSIQAAVDAALDNDLILVRAGSYGDITISNKALVITADAGAVVHAGQVSIQNQAANKSLAISGIDMNSNSGGIGVSLINNAGPIFIERATISGSGLPFFQTNTAIRASNCENVTLVTCSVSVGFGSGPYAGIDAFGSRFHIYESTVRGGDGDMVTAGLPGGNGISVSGGFLFASGTTFIGGNGSPGTVSSPFGICTDGFPGGNGLALTSGTPVAKVLDCTFIGGPGGPAGGPACINGLMGQGMVVSSGSLVTFPEEARTYDISSPVREGQIGFLSLAGDAGEFVWVFLSFAHAPGYSDVWKGTLLPGAPQIIIFIGALPPSGAVTFNVPVPINPAMVSGALYEQALYYTAAKGFVASHPRLGVVLDQSL